MDEQFWFRWEVEVNDIVQHRYVDAASSEIGDHEDTCCLVTKLRNIDLTRRLVKGTVAARACDPGLLQNLVGGLKVTYKHNRTS